MAIRELICPRCGHDVDWEEWRLIHRSGECIIYKWVDDKLESSPLPRQANIRMEFYCPSIKEDQPMPAPTFDLSNADLDEITETALEFFWERVAKRIPQATSGDLSPETVIKLKRAALEAVKEWYNNNCKDLN